LIKINARQIEELPKADKVFIEKPMALQRKDRLCRKAPLISGLEMEIGSTYPALIIWLVVFKIRTSWLTE
jgi:hypothetical protein